MRPYKYRVGSARTERPRSYLLLVGMLAFTSLLDSRSNDCVNDSQSTVKGQLGDLSGGELSVGVPEFDHGSIIQFWREPICPDTVISGFLYLVMDWNGIVQVYCLRDDWVLRNLSGVGLEDKLPKLGLVAVAFFDVVLVA